MTEPSADRDAVPVGHRPGIAGLRQLGLISALVAAAAGLASLSLAIATGDAALGRVTLVTLALSVWLLLTRRRAEQGGELRYIGWMAVGLLVGMLALLPLVPAVAPSIAVASLIPLFMAVPHLDHRALGRWALGRGYSASPTSARPRCSKSAMGWRS